MKPRAARRFVASLRGKCTVAAATLFSLLLLVSCATPLQRGPVANEGLAMNQGAGLNDLLVIPLSVQGGQGCLFVLDTGAPLTILDHSLIGNLGKAVGRENIVSMYGREPAFYYNAPELMWADTRLRTGPRVLTWDLNRISADLGKFNKSNYQLKGILGMDCLRHYCVQLDFDGRVVRLLDPARAAATELGTPYRLGVDRQGCPTVQGEIAGRKGSLLIDTGCIVKGNSNVLGLDFFADYVATFNFPKRTLYLKPRDRKDDERTEAKFSR